MISFTNDEIIVVGDLILDEYTYGSALRLSPEAPVPIINVDRSSYSLGGAANVAANIRSLGGNPVLIGCIGNDYLGDIFLRAAKDLAIRTDMVVRAGNSRQTSLKTRVIANHQQVARLDRETTTPLQQDDDKKISMWLLEKIPQSKAIIVSDYAKGLLTRSLLRLIANSAEAAGVPIFLDPKVGNSTNYPRYLFAMTPNIQEAEGMIAEMISTRTHWKIQTDADIEIAAEILLRTFDCKYTVITRGERGMTLASLSYDEMRTVHIPTTAKTVYDVSGAGDTAIATLVLSYASGYDIAKSAELANRAGGIVVGKPGTATVSMAELELE